MVNSILEQLGDDTTRSPAKTAAITLAVLIAGICLVFVLGRGNTESARQFRLQAPEQTQEGWQGKTLEEPSIKTHGSTAIQCYCPATGQALGLVNPSTPDGIDRAIAKAKECQPEWAKAPFSERRRVLKTILKCVRLSTTNGGQYCQP